VYYEALAKVGKSGFKKTGFYFAGITFNINPENEFSGPVNNNKINNIIQRMI